MDELFFTSTLAVAHSSVAATGTAAGPMPISSAPPFMGTAVRRKSGFGIAVVVFCAHFRRRGSVFAHR